MASNGRTGSTPVRGTIFLIINMEDKFICECGKEFKSKNSLKSHYRFCKIHKPKSKVSKYKIDDNLYKCECGKEFNNFQSLNAHFGHCNFHHECRGTTRKGHTSELTKSMCWENKTVEEIKEIRNKAGKTFSLNLKTGKIVNGFKNHKHTQENKERIRKSTLKYLEKTICSFKARYSINACKYIDELNKKFGWNLQHAENGGEVSVAGYFLDGYDKELNIAFEYDEPIHYIDVENNILREKDIERQNYIIGKLNCKFYRYNEKLDKFYEII